jgi:hypothetical protein
MGGEQDRPASKSLLIDADGPRFNIRAWGDTSTLETVLTGGFNIDRLTLDASVPKYTPISGDIVFRSGLSTEQQLAAAGGLMSDVLGRPVHFERRSLPCDVVVASGSGIEPGENAASVVFADDGPPKKKSPVFRTPSKAFFKSNLPALLNCRVIDQTTGPAVTIAWQAAFAGPVVRSNALQSLTEQTGIRFSVEKRNFDQWTMREGPATQPAPADAPTSAR